MFRKHPSRVYVAFPNFIMHDRIPHSFYCRTALVTALTTSTKKFNHKVFKIFIQGSKAASKKIMRGRNIFQLQTETPSVENFYQLVKLLKTAA